MCLCFEFNISWLVFKVAVFIYKMEKKSFSTLFSSVTLKDFAGVNYHKCFKKATQNLLLPTTH